MVAIAMILPPLATLPWKRGSLARAMEPLWGVLALSVALGALAWTLQTGRSMLAPVGVALSAWLVLGALTELAARARLGRAGAAETLRRLRHLPRADWGKALAHSGLGLTILGIACITAWQREDIRVVRPGDSFPLGSYALRLEAVERTEGPNYTAETATLTILQGGRAVGTLHPERRIYPVQGMPTTEAAIDRSLTRDLYVALGDPQADGGWALRSYLKPFANWIWIGALVMAAGGIVSLTDRRYRVGAPARRAPRGAEVPAE
jgi:cytochrome c-type biogenesis protein CcmF